MGAKLVHDPWMTNFLHRQAYRLLLDADRSAELVLPEGVVFIFTKVAPHDLATIKWLETRGFHLVDTNILFDKPVTATKKLAGHCTVRFAQPSDEAGVVQVARNNFIYSRFHLDEAIDNEMANQIKAAWAGNYFRGDRGDQMVVAVVEGQVVGFNQLLYRDDIVTIDLIAVDKKFHRRGIAGDMINYAETESPDVQHIRVGTQLANLPSIQLYEKIGFRLLQAQYVFHYHGEGGEEVNRGRVVGIERAY